MKSLCARLTEAAQVIEEINARDGLPLNTPVNPTYLRDQANTTKETPK